jgi:hypothetical protein
VFYEFDRHTSYASHLLSTYNSLFGSVDSSYDTISKNLLSVSVAFILNVYLLNMLVTVIGDRLHDMDAVAVLTDSKERLDLIMEAALFKRIFVKKREERPEQRCIIFCEEVVAGENEDETDELKNQVASLADRVGRIEERLQRDLGRFEDNLYRLEGKIEEHVNRKLDMILHLINSEKDDMNEYKNAKKKEIQETQSPRPNKRFTQI